jgi:hypothetical protein
MVKLHDNVKTGFARPQLQTYKEGRPAPCTRDDPACQESIFVSIFKIRSDIIDY